MALTKPLQSYRCSKLVGCIIRQLNTKTDVGSEKVASPFRKMSVNQWKLISYLKENLSEKRRVTFDIRKEWGDRIRKLPAFSSFVSTNQVQGITKKPAEFYDQVQVVNDWKSRFNQKLPPPAKITSNAKWRLKKKTVSTESVISRTLYLISALKAAKTDESVLKQLADFTLHLLEYPDATGLAVNGRAVQVLLRIRACSKAEEVVEATQEALAMVGYADPPTGRGIRILSIDGGGVRGLLVIEMLRKLEQLTNKKVHEMFDYICGVSTGSIIACTIGASGKSLDEISQLYKLLSTQILTQNAFEGIRSLLIRHGYYDSGLWEKILQEHVGDTPMHQTARKKRCPKIGVVSAVTNHGKLTPFVFRNYNFPFRVRSQYRGSNRYKLWEATRASAAAPVYFGEFHLGPYLHQDGGMLVNNPTAVALHEAKLLWPKTRIQCVVSCGTGRKDPTTTLHRDEQDGNEQSSWQNKVTQILSSATDTEGVHTIMSDVLPSDRYFRFNPYLTEKPSMVESQPEKLALLEKDAAMYIQRNGEKFAEAAEKLTESKPKLARLCEWLTLQYALYGSF